MFFVAFFWAFFSHRACFRWAACGRLRPSIRPIRSSSRFCSPWSCCCRATTVTWAHHSLLGSDRSGLLRGLALTVFLGLCFTSLQVFEYSNAEFHFTGGIYPSTFFMATGFHGFHVIIGTTFLIVCLGRRVAGHSGPTTISASKRPHGIGISSMSSGCFCSSASIGGVAAARRKPGRESGRRKSPTPRAGVVTDRDRFFGVRAALGRRCGRCGADAAAVRGGPDRAAIRPAVCRVPIRHAEHPPVMTGFRPQFWPTIIAIPIVLVCLALGSWQIQRLFWKEGLIAARAAAVAAPRSRCRKTQSRRAAWSSAMSAAKACC